MLNYSILIYYTLLTTNFSSSAEFFSTRDYGYIRYSIPEKKEGALGIKLQISWFFYKDSYHSFYFYLNYFFSFSTKQGNIYPFYVFIPCTKYKEKTNFLTKTSSFLFLFP